MPQRISVVCLTLLSLSSLSQAQPPSYTSTEIGSLSGGSTVAYGMNINGDIVGQSTVSDRNQGAFVYLHSTGTLMALDGQSASGINDYGKISGTQAPPGPYWGQPVAWYLSGGYDVLPTVSNQGGYTTAVSSARSSTRVARCIT